MSVTVDERRTRLRSVLSTLLTVALLVPVGILFTQVWRSTSDEIATTEREQRGTEYLASLGQLLTATVDAQAAALQGRATAKDALTRAVNATADVDQRLGDELGTRERWADLRARIGQLPQGGAGGQAAYAAYVEVTDLLMALFRAVRDNSDLVRATQSDTFYLQQAVTDQIPQATVQAARLADLAVMGPGNSAAQRQQAAVAVGAAAQSVDTAVDQMTDDLQEAVDKTDSRTLSGSLLGVLDRFRRGVEGVLLTASGQAGAAGAAQLPAARGELRAAGADLTATVLREMDGLLQSRLDDLRSRQRLAVGVLAAAVLLALAAVLLPLLDRRRRSRRAHRPAVTTGTPSPIVVAAEPVTPAIWSERDRSDLMAGFATQYDQDTEPARWERSDAVR
jgi:hypothetical protein